MKERTAKEQKQTIERFKNDVELWHKIQRQRIEGNKMQIQYCMKMVNHYLTSARLFREQNVVIAEQIKYSEDKLRAEGMIK